MISQFITKYSSFENKNKFLIHLTVWSLLLLLPYVLSIYSTVKLRLDFLFLSILVHLIIFYVNYSVLIPSLLFKKRITGYLFLSVALFLTTFFIKDLMMNYFFDIRIVDHGKFMFPNKQNFSQSSYAAFPQFGIPYNMRFIFMTNSFMFFYIVSLSLRFIQKWRNDEKYKAKLEKDKVSTELSLLKQQINPHFVFNSLNSIYSLSISNSKSVSESILKLSSILRYMLYNSENNTLKSNDELTIIEDYIQLQKLRLCDNVSVNYKLISETNEYKIEPLIIITLLENAFKYGANTDSNSFIDILIIIINGKLTLRIRNKIVRQFQFDENIGGIGLKNVQRRLDLVYPNRYKYNAGIKNMVYTVFLEIDL